MTEPVYVTETRTAYDTVAENYAEMLKDFLQDATWDRAVLAAFAELVGEGPVGDLGCGPGRLTGYLKSLGLDVFGVDLSPEMVAVARRTHPDLRFDVGTLAALDLDGDSLAGALAWYSLIHTPPEELPVLAKELCRVLRPGGWLLTAFQVGENQRKRIENAYGHDIGADAYRLDPDFMAQLLADAGFVVDARVVREPGPSYEATQQAYLMARKKE
ncbi:class I SAM-dependent DNA methyltransferase [Amycolatopsis sp. WGS_07]|uniref:class I SAM-dependent DNA methyltransferase n=1 Tax=Amycolatopsis sp. WGS_07 TaxID=3076764 RepID=UPI003872F8E5